MASLWETQGGGIAELVNGVYRFVESPDWWPNQEGKEVPPEWGLIPISDEAFSEMDATDSLDPYDTN